MSILPSFRDALEIVKTLTNAEVKSKLYDALIEAQQQSMELLEENGNLREQVGQLSSEIASLKEELRIRGSMVFDPAINAYWLEGDGNQKDGPYCSKCYDADGVQLRLHTYGNGFSGCPNCTTTIKYGPGGQGWR